MRGTPARILARRALYQQRSRNFRNHDDLLSSPSPLQPSNSRTIFSFFRRAPSATTSSDLFRPAPQPSLLPTDLFHPLSHSPFPALVQKADRVKAASLCPVSYDRYGERLHPKFDCPDCGWPTHYSEERWKEGLSEHKQYCDRLREVNEDEHDIRSGRRMREFEDMPSEQPYEAAVSFSSWDNFFFTRSFLSIDNDRSIRHVSKVLTYPITIAGVLHQNGPFTYSNSRITSEGRRSMAAIHSVLHLPPGSSSDTAPIKPSPPFRLFLLGARAESTLPPSIWEQLTYLFPRTNFNIYFIGPEVGLPLIDKDSPKRKIKEGKDGYKFEDASESQYGVESYTFNVSSRLRLISLKSSYEELHDQLGPFDPYTDVFFAFSPGLGFPHQGPVPSASTGADAESGTHNEESTLLDRGDEVKREESSSSASEAADAYSPPEVESTSIIDESQPLVQAQTTWAIPLRQILKTKCPLFFTAFSPLDLERDVSALFSTQPPSTPPSAPAEFPSYVHLPTKPVSKIEGVTDEFELVLNPGKNDFGSLKWEIAEWDTRVGVRTNWGVWGIRGKKYEVTQKKDR